jgi:hypothetical protein
MRPTAFELFFQPALLLQRRLELLRVIEALRLHAYITGKWPANLADVTCAPVPDDPLTGQPFHYRHDGDAILLEAPRPTPQSPPYHALIYRILLRPRSGETP